MPVAGLLGRNPSPAGAIELKLSDVVDVKAVFPKIPKTFGHGNLARTLNLGMLGNDVDSDCVPAGGIHRHMVSSTIHGRPFNFTTDNALAAYAAMNGHKLPIVPGSSNDQGTNMADAAKWEQKVGFTDANGNNFKIDLFAEVEPGDMKTLLVAMYLFDEVGNGIQVQNAQQQQFAAGKPWKWVNGQSVEGGHYVSGIGFDGKNIDFMTWGAVAKMTPQFWEKSGDELIAYIDLDNLQTKSKETLEHVDLAGLQKYLPELPK